MISLCDQLAAYVDNQLDAAESEAFSQHLAGCLICRDALHDMLQLVALETDRRTRQPPGEPVDSRSARNAPRPQRRSRRGARVAIAAVAAVAAAVLPVTLWMHGSSVARDETPPVLATSPVRGVEGRISYAAADSYRPYDVARSGSVSKPIDSVPLDTLAQLEHRGDLHGVAAAFLLMKDPRRAAEYLDRALPTPGVASDRALIERADRRPADALITLDAVLETAPHHPQALWNRALVLVDIGLPLSAAEAFRAVAALNEPGWSEEARTRAKALSDEANEVKAALLRLANDDGPRLATAPDAVTAGVARRFPGMTRLMFYNAMRSATSADVVRRLASLAKTLDEVYGGNVLVGYVERVLHADFTRRAPLAERYATFLAGQRPDEAAAHAWFAALRAAKQDDILLGAIVLVSSGRVPSAQIPELRRLAAELHDPWFDLLAVEQAARAAISSGDYAAAEALVLPALASCATRPIEYRCANLDSVLGESYLLTLRLSDMRRVVDEGRARAQRAGEWYIAQEFLKSLARLESVKDDVAGTTLPLVRAYLREVVLREPERCDHAVWYHELVAEMMVSRLDLARARDEIAQVIATKRACPERGPDLAFAEAKVHVLRDPGSASADEFAALRAEIAALRTMSPPGSGARAALDQVEGSLLIDRDRVAGTALLNQAITAAQSARPDDVDARRARAYAYAILVLDAGRAGQWDRVWSLLGDDVAITPAARCTLGAAIENHASLVVIRDAAGKARGVFEPAWRGPVVDATTLIPAALRDALRACPSIEVVAPSPVQAVPELLPMELAWSYRIGPNPPPREAELHRRVVISGAEPPVALDLPPLLPWRTATADVVLEGPSATPSRALAELAEATFVEIHAHGMVKAAVSDASFLMLSPEADGRYALTAGAIRHQQLRGHPIVVLAACHAAVAANYRHEAWSLPAAFVAAGARAVIASTDVISDADAGAFFDDLRARIEQGATPAVALRDTRARWLASHPAASWTRSLMVFQ
jgi:hypothetical protein